jgi:murein DD-endopeptidase MepM/ murein hydrolase activator NlpD
MLPVLVALALLSGVYAPPVPDPVVERFAPPACRWCPGNRGIDYRPPAGSPVRAAGDGIVAFAGPVGGRLVVALAHPDGLRTTYTDLAAVVVVAGQRVTRGAVVGRSSGHLHLGVRRGAVYLDPEVLLAGRTRARLVPSAEPRSRTGG